MQELREKLHGLDTEQIHKLRSEEEDELVVHFFAFVHVFGAFFPCSGNRSNNDDDSGYELFPRKMSPAMVLQAQGIQPNVRRHTFRVPRRDSGAHFPSSDFFCVSHVV